MRALTISLAILLAAPAAAQATSLRISSGVLRYSVTTTAQSRMTVTQIPGTIVVHDDLATFTATAPCTKAGPHDGTCPDSTVRSISISGGNLADVFDVSTLGYPATINGGAGDDLLHGGLGNDRLSGGDGNDAIDGGPGADRMSGGRGRDIVSYATHTTGVNVSLDGKANDGSPGENDNVGSDVEQVNGSPQNDVLMGSSRNDNLQGEAGDDRIDGGPGADVLGGGPGRDTLDYSSRSVGVTVDLAAGSARTFTEADRVLGFEDVIGSGRDDTLRGDDGPNRLDGGPGNDTLDGRLGADLLIGGAGFDTATYADRHQPVTVTLEGRANDGAGGEGDNVTTSVEAVTGGSAGDRITGNSRANRLRGGGGNDSLTGGRGRDTIDGGAGRDRISGGSGDDLLSGGPGRDLVRGGRGGDFLFTRDHSRDTVQCGSGRGDAAVVDRRDRVSGCERVNGHRRG